MQPPKELDVLDAHNGFVALTRNRSGSYSTLWRPGRMLKKTAIGQLKTVNESTFYQNNDNATLAIYSVPGYTHRVAVWFDNVTGERIA